MNVFIILAITLSIVLTLALWAFGLCYTIGYILDKTSWSDDKAVVLGVPAYLIATIIVLLLLGVVL